LQAGGTVWESIKADTRVRAVNGRRASAEYTLRAPRHELALICCLKLAPIAYSRSPAAPVWEVLPDRNRHARVHAWIKSLARDPVRVERSVMVRRDPVQPAFGACAAGYAAACMR